MRLSEVHDVLSDIETQLTWAAELQLSGAIDLDFYESTMRGALQLLPRLAATGHIVLLKGLRKWHDIGLISDRLCETLQDALVVGDE